MFHCFKILLSLFVCLNLCQAQETGCFKLNPQSDLQLETTHDFSRYNAFFVGEFHGIKGVPEVKLALIKYLNQTQGITDVFMEIGTSAAWLYNSYLETGDTSFISKPMLPYAQQQYYRDFWKALYSFDSGISKKLRIHGIDFERIEFIKVLRLLKPMEKTVSWAIKNTISFIDTVSLQNSPALYSEDFSEQNEIYEKVRTEMQANRQEFEYYYAEDFSVVAKMMFNENTYRNYDNRNRAMYHNLIAEMTSEGIKKFVLFAGMNHGNKNGLLTLSNRLKKNKVLRNHFAEMDMLCKDCYEGHLHFDYKGPNSFDKLILMPAIYDKYFNLACKYTMIATDTIEDSKVQHYSDYLILMKDQPDY